MDEGCEERREDEQNEVSMVRFSDAVVHPRAVLCKGQDKNERREKVHTIHLSRGWVCGGEGSGPPT